MMRKLSLLNSKNISSILNKNIFKLEYNSLNFSVNEVNSKLKTIDLIKILRSETSNN